MEGNKMLEKLITDNKENFKGYYVFVICMWKDKMCLVPCDDEMSGYYPVYDKAVNISDMQIVNFPNKINGQNIDAIILKLYKESIEFDFAEDTWDGFQPLGDL